LVAYVVVWFQLWSYRDVASWTILKALLLLSVPIALYLVSHLAGPDLGEDKGRDLRVYYYEQHRLLQGLLAIAVVLSTVAIALLTGRSGGEPFLIRLVVVSLLVAGIVALQ